MRSSIVTSFTGLLLLCSATAAAQSPRKHLLHLSSEPMAGREVGTPGHDLARDYIQETMAGAGLQPGGIDGTWFVPVSVVRRARPSTETSLRLGEHVLARGVEYQLAGISDEATFSETPILVGYGLSAAQVGWDDYADADVRGRVVVALTGAPPEVAERLEDEDAYLLEMSSKAAVALAAGARAILFVNDPRSHGDRSDQRADGLPALMPAFPLRGIGVGVVTAHRATAIFGAAGLDLARYQAMLDAGTSTTVEAPIACAGHFRIEREVVESQNVVGRIDGTTPAAPIALGAHYDHLGIDGPGSRYDGEAIHPGADDNASGVAVLLSTATHLAAAPQPPSRTVLFIATTGEELGLRGARQAAHLLRGDAAGIYLNLDMVGRLRDDTLHAYGIEHAPTLASRVREAAKAQQVRLEPHPLRESDSDHIAFADRGWTAMSFSTGRHTDYHLPSDTIDGIDWSGLQRVEAVVEALVSDLATQ